MRPVRLGVKPAQSMMVPYQLKPDGICSTCESTVPEKGYIECHSCNHKFHADCNKTAPYCAKSYIEIVKNLQKKANFTFRCDHCVTSEEHVAASSMQEQLAEVVKAVQTLTKEVKQLKEEKKLAHTQAQEKNDTTDAPKTTKKSVTWKDQTPAWSDTDKLKKVKEKVTVCIKSNGEEVDMSKVGEVIANNGIQITKTTVSKANGDVYLDLPSNETRDNLIPLLDQADIQGNRVINVKQKCPTISLKNVSDYTEENEFITKVKQQNPGIKEKIENGCEFSVVYKKDIQTHTDTDQVQNLIVLRVGNEIREAIKTAGDRIFLGVSSHRVMDRVYIKSCAKCHKFGHYHKDCQNTTCCGYCLSQDHTSEDCPLRQQKEVKKYKCVNCKDHQKEFEGHSSHYPKCPTYLEVQKKKMMQIPYYSKNN